MRARWNLRNLNDTEFWERAIRRGVVERMAPGQLVAALRDREDGFDDDVWLAVHGRVVRSAMAEMRLHPRIRNGRPSITRADPGLTRGEKRSQPGIPRIEYDDILDQAHLILLEALLNPRAEEHVRLVDALVESFGTAIRNIVGRAVYRLEATLNGVRKVQVSEPGQGKGLGSRVLRRLSPLDDGTMSEQEPDAASPADKADYVRLLAMARKMAAERGVLQEFLMRRRGIPFDVIGSQMGVSGQTVRNRLANLFKALEIDPDYLNRRRAAARKRAKQAGGADGGVRGTDAAASVGGGGVDPGPGTPLAASP